MITITSNMDTSVIVSGGDYTSQFDRISAKDIDGLKLTDDSYQLGIWIEDGGATRIGGKLIETIKVHGTVSSGTETFDLDDGTYHTATVGGDFILAFDNWPLNGLSSITIKFTNAGAHTITWPGAVDWQGAEPSWSVTGSDFVLFFSDDAGVTIYGQTYNTQFDRISAKNANGLEITDDSYQLGVFVEDGGNVGIGTDTPSGLLHVAGTSYFDDDITLAAATHLVLPLHNDAATPTLAFGDGDSGIYEASDDWMYISNGGIRRWYFSENTFSGDIAGAAQILNIDATATVPSLTFNGDPDTGLGTAAADQLSLIAGGVEGIRITENTAIYTTNMGGSVVHRTASASGYNPSILTSDYIIAITNTDAARAVTISTEDEDTGSTDNPRVMIVKDESGGAAAHNITITLESSGGTIDGAANYIINQNYQSISLYIDGTNAFIF